MKNLSRLIRFRIITNQYSTSTSDSKWPRQVLSAIQPTGKIHLGNYMGAIKRWVELQKSEENPVIFGIADLHSITMSNDPQQTHSNILATAATLLACGIDVKKCILFQQSRVTQHTQLCWILATLATMPKLTHMVQYKEKSKTFKEIPVGIFLYPVLQAADIMLYRGSHIPVGEDQIQHLELVNHLVRRFNNSFGETFPTVNSLIDPTFGKVKNLNDPTKKMSKSDLNPKSTINLMDTPEEILFKCRKALTDFKSEVTFEGDARPGVTNLILIHSGLSGKSPEQIVQESVGLDTGKYKMVLAEFLIEHLKPIRHRVLEYLNSPEYLVQELDTGASKAKEIAEKTIQDVHQKMGFDLKKLVLDSNNLEKAEGVV